MQITKREFLKKLGLASKAGIRPRDLDITALQKALRAHNVFI